VVSRNTPHLSSLLLKNRSILRESVVFVKKTGFGGKLAHSAKSAKSPYVKVAVSILAIPKIT
jgi:hypothetical protein